VKIVGFIKFYNEASKGNLERALKCLDSICSEVVCADDGSTDNSLKVATRNSKHHLIHFEKPDLPKELQRKQEMLEYALKLDPDWILWIDGDECLEKRAVEGIKKLCRFGNEFGVDGFAFHEVNLWRAECWYRLDNAFNNLWKINLWRNTGSLKFDSSKGLHKPQHPMGLTKIMPCNLQLLHYGFSSTKLVLDKYLMYKRLGQSGWPLNRLIDEKTLQLEPANLSWFPDYAKPELVPKPEPMTEKQWLELAGGKK